MNTKQARAAMNSRTTVQAGSGDDHDLGLILDLDGNHATVAWDSGVKTRTPITDIHPHGAEPDWYVPRGRPCPHAR